ncbi:sugar phosphate permease [Kushneria sinocarnis]|uniref:Sugar phosphate permease n=1 Tax=Kushneria sinocarnis TaxID=595502 RepID=A0A420WW75_9GAMM|nr:MFS transporter [Kushneria sinocarnis]RKR03361.1 sugar phosphate permease [Kushneria sinocarnis]
MTQASAAPASKVRYRIVLWLLVGGMINYIDRANLSIAAPAMIAELGLDNTDIGLMGTVFAWCYAVAQLPAGWIADRFGARLVYALALLAWSLATMGMGLASALWVFLLLRVLLGFGEAPCWPTAAKVTSFWFPRQERGIATGIFDSASKWGPALAPPVLVGVLAWFGWRGLFLFTGLVGAVFALVFYLFYRNPDRHARLPQAEFDWIESGGGGHEQVMQRSPMPWRALFAQRSVWGMILGYFCTIWIWNIFLVFLPLYLKDSWQITLTEMGFYSSIPWIGGALGNIASGFVARSLVERQGLPSLKARQYIIAVSALVAAGAVIALPFMGSLAMTIALMTLALAFISAITGSAWALAGDVAPPSMVASVGSIQNFGGYFGGAFSPLVAGMIVDTTGSWSLAFISGGIIAAGAAICYLWIVRDPIVTPEAEDR